VAKEKIKVSDIVVFIVIAAGAVLVLMPLIWLAFAAFKSSDVLLKYTFLPPISEWGEGALTLKNFASLFFSEKASQGTTPFLLALANSLFLAGAQMGIQMLFCSMGGFALHYYDFKGKRAITVFLMATLMIPPIVLLGPQYQLIFSLKLMDSFGAILLPVAVSSFGIFLYRQAMESVPKSLFEAARIDGSSEWGLYWNIAMPLCRPISGAFCLISFLQGWNNFIAPQIFLASPEMQPLPVVLQQYVGLYQTEYGIFLAGTFLAVIPPVIIFAFLQREFIASLTSGAVKG